MNIASIIEFFESMIKSTSLTKNDAAYGAGMAGAPFDPAGFMKKPQVILRIINLLFSLIVFSSIATEASYKQGTCAMNNDGTACGYGILVGVIGFLSCIVFLILDARFENLSSIKIRKRVVVADMIFSFVWSVVWFLIFCYNANEWRKTSAELEAKSEAYLIRLSLAFTFFSIITWSMIGLLNFLRYRQGVSDIFDNGYEDPNQEQIPTEPYRQAPFNNNFNSEMGYQANY
ncbi:synaptogyrin-2-like [Brachionus plicatilis]|uniref:Synaptogyrin n=1 Tax=Brachionus plicatilis TaxID=10195 RepID=A0A3M7SKK2_BRAPC|nr:synaptogyrin-2-like [Brachionus plicatilis]